jgi:beta-galactosidase/beta-glucuronidase
MICFAKFRIITLFLCFASFALLAQNDAVKLVKLTDFELQSSTAVDEPGEQLSLPGYRSTVHWFPVKVPSTVLTGLVANRIYPDPYIGMNNMIIPDASDDFNRQYNLEQYSFLPNNPNPWKKPYWYRTTFTVPAEKGRHYELIFKGINYRAAVWINGKQIADSSKMAGMFAEYFIDVTPYIRSGGENALAVKIYPLDYPGLPSQEQLKALDDFYANGGPTGDIGKNVTMLCSVGWDWIPPVRDRNMGIWQPVYLRTSGSVTISRPHIVTDLPNLPDTSIANISLKFLLTNHNQSGTTGKISVILTPENFIGETIQFSKDISLLAGKSKLIDLNSGNQQQLIINQPRLWWPIHYGRANLYRMQIQFIANSGVTDETILIFGIRTVSSQAVEAGKFFHRDFYVNGKRVYLQGGAWVPDMMLNTDSVRYDDELRLCRNANVNLLRIWGGGITPPDVFFDLADRYGMLVWSDFWITGDTQGEFKGSPDYPLESKVFIDNMTSTIYRIRNHPSLLVWTGGNEGHARKELYDAMRDSIITLDGTRPFLPSSSGFAKLPAGWKGSWPDGKAAGVYSSGPYQWTDPHEYYVMAEKNIDWAFKDEVGIPSQPPYNSLVKIIPNLIWDKKAPYPMNNTWGYHDAATGNGRYDRYYKDMVKRYGEPVSMEDFSDKMQLMNATGYQGIFEAAQHKLKDNGGVMLWKLNAAFPSVIWQIYDWYLQPNAGFYFMQNACEPLHIQLNLNDSAVAVVNRKHKNATGLIAEAYAYSAKTELLFHQTATIDLGADDVKRTSLSIVPFLQKAMGVSFIVLRLKDSTGSVISRNIYWLDKNKDYNAMQQMPRTRVQTKITDAQKGVKQYTYKVQINNPSKQLAFFTRLQMMVDGEEILPSPVFRTFLQHPHNALKINI